MTDFGTPGSIPPPPSPAGRTGPAWEQPGSFFQRWVDTAKSILMDPQGGFRNVRRSGGLGAPLSYYAVGASPAIIGYLLFNLVIGGMGMLGSDDAAGAAAGAAILGGGMIGVLVMVIAMYVIGFFIITGLVHLVLSLLGGAKHGYEATLRTFAYAHGSALPIAIIPFCAPIAGLWALVCEIFGLAEMQETTPVKAAIAIFSPILLCCLLWFLAWGAVMALIMGSAASSNM